MIRIFIIFLYLFNPNFVFAEIEFALDSYLDTYYAYDQNQSNRRQYTTQAYYNDEIAINLITLGSRLKSENLRARFSLQEGSSVDANYQSERHEDIKYIQETNIGVQISKGLWLEGGIYFSHIGLESWISKDNWAYTRSLVSEFTPYYQSGIKLTYEFNSSDHLSIQALNGWQNITNNQDLAFGLQYYNQLTPKSSFNYSNFIGDVNGLRIFNDFVYKFQANEWLEIASIFDIGRQTLPDDQTYWYGFAALTRIRLAEKLFLSLRLEKFSDPKQVIVTSNTDESFRVWGTSVNLDYQITNNLFWRNEVKYFFAGNSVFANNELLNQSNLLLVTSLSFSLDQLVL